MASKNQEYFDAAIRNQIGLQRFASRAVRDLLRVIEENDAELTVKLRREIQELTGEPVGMRDKKLKELLDLVKENRKNLLRDMRRRVEKIMQEVGYEEEEKEAALLLLILGSTASLGALSAGDLRSLRLDEPISGRTISQWFNSLAVADYSRLLDRLQGGLFANASTEQIIRSIIGTRALRYVDGALSVTRRNFESIFRSAVNHMANRTRELLWKKNAKSIEFLRWAAVLDGRTTEICRSRDGKHAPLDGVSEVPPPRLDPPNARPPAHPNCRSIMYPVFVGGGPVDDENYDAWLRRQPAAFQDEVLGPTRAKKFRDGKLTLDFFVAR